MFRNHDIQRIRALVADAAGPVPSQVYVSRANGLHVRLENGQAEIAAEDRNALARGFFLLACALKEGRSRLCIDQSRHFSSCGAMIDVSRNAVLTVPAVKRTLDRLAMLGMNLLMLYMEDTYTIPEYPYLGYLRGRYSPQELREMDDYAASLDIELVPCIQTLGHMAQFLQWESSSPLRDQPDILQVDLPETYQFIERAVAGLRSCMRAKRIHVGMDEAFGVGLGKYYTYHGASNPFELLNRHLRRVCDICSQYDFHPMMWSDMFFRMGSRRGEYYDSDAVIPPEVLGMIPEVDLCYWDYYHTDEAFYDRMLAQHATMGSTAFAGGIWTWSGFLPHVKRTQATMEPALNACVRRHVDTVFATMWGDDGAETNFFLAFNQLPIFSEACWQGTQGSHQEIARLGECLTGLPDAAFRLFGDFYPSERERCTGKGLIWCDLLYPLMEYGFESMADASARFRRAENALHAYSSIEECRYAQLCFRIAAMKGEIIGSLRERYLAGDRDYLQKVADQLIPDLQVGYQQLLRAHRCLWERDMKRFGWEVLALRYGAVTGRLADIRDELSRYLAGTLPSIPELEEEPLPVFRSAGQHYRGFVTPNASL